MNIFEWTDKYSVKVKEIDEQHKKLVATINRLAQAIEKNMVEQEIHNIFNELTNYTLEHFNTEEKYFDKFKYKNTEEHKKKHQEFRDKISDFKKKLKNKEIEISFELIDFLEDWLLEHLIKEDQKYIKCFQENGLK